MNTINKLYVLYLYKENEKLLKESKKILFEYEKLNFDNF